MNIHTTTAILIVTLIASAFIGVGGAEASEASARYVPRMFFFIPIYTT